MRKLEEELTSVTSKVTESSIIKQWKNKYCSDNKGTMYHLVFVGTNYYSLFKKKSWKEIAIIISNMYSEQSL